MRVVAFAEHVTPRGVRRLVTITAGGEDFDRARDLARSAIDGAIEGGAELVKLIQYAPHGPSRLERGLVEVSATWET